MKKKKFIHIKEKKKSELKNFYSLAYSELYSDFNKKNFITFFKIMLFFNLTTAIRITVLMGVTFSSKFKFIRIRNLKRLLKILVLKFYFDYSYIKEKKFELLKTIITFKTVRYFFSLPLRGQRSRTHAKTRKKYSIV